MNLKEAFRYQNYLDTMFTNAQMYLKESKNVIKVTQQHMRSKVNPDAEDEQVDMTRERVANCSPAVVINYLLSVLREKSALSAAINAAKRSMSFDLDSEVSVNKYRQYAKAALSFMSSIKASEQIHKGTGYKFNAEGNQVPYFYDIKEVTSIDFDRNEVRRLVKMLAADADKVSADADRCIIETQVDFVPLFDLSDTFEDSLAAFAGAFSSAVS